MANTLNSLLESANPWQSQQSHAEKLVTKWKKSGLLEGLEGQHKKNMAVILENQAKQLVVESSTAGGGTTSGANFTTGTGEQWAGVALPLVRKVFGQIASKEFVSVQPMNLPAGLVFYLDFQYGTSGVNPFQTGAANGSLFGKQTIGADGSGFGNDKAGGLYGAGRFGYSINQFSASSAANVTATSASWADVNFDATYSASVIAGEIKRLNVPTASLSSDIDLNGVRAFIISSGSVVTATSNLQAFTSTNGTSVNFFVSASTAQIPTLSAFTVWYNKKTDFNKRGDFEDAPTTGFSTPNAQSPTSIVIPEINVQMRSEAIAAKTRKLKAQWTPEFAQDLNAYHSIDAEAELTSMLSEYISLEIDLEILDMLIENAPTTEAWSAKVGNAINASTGAVTSNVNGVFYTQMTWFQTLGIKLQKISNIIHQRTLRGGANFMMVSPAVSTILESIPGFAADSDGAADTMKYAFGVQKIGQLNSRYKVYKNPYMTENLILMGFRGNQFLECGAVYAPYVPLIMTPLVYDPATFTPRKGIMTRYAKKMIRPEFYGKVFISDLDIV
jgi:Major capsid protein Gp23